MYFLKRNLTPSRKSLLGLLLVFFGLTFFHLGRGAVDSKGIPPTTTPNLSAKADGLYVTNLLVFMAGIVNSDCSAIDYTITIRNASTEGEAFAENQITIVDVNDVLFVANMVPSDKTGDATPATFDPGDSWEYTATRALGPTDLNLDQIQNQATVTAGGMDFLSDDLALPGSNDPTVLDISRCRSIGAVLSVSTLDWFGASPGCETIEYQLSVLHNGMAKESLTNIQITNIGPSLTFVLENPNSGDLNSNNLLDVNEIWKYTATRPLDQNDFDLVTLKEQVTITAEVDGNPAATVTDLSHPSDFLDDELTNIDVNCEKGSIALIKTAENLGNCNQLLYTFTLTHLNTVAYNFVNVVLEDPAFGGVIAEAPVENGGIVAGELEPGETWTYQAYYDVTPDNISDGFVLNQAYVSAEVKDKVPVTLSVDASDPSDINQDRETNTSLSNCDTSIGVIMTSESLAFYDGSPGCSLVQFTVLIRNTSINQEPLHNIVINGLGPNETIEGPFGNGVEDNVLDFGDDWTYVVTRALLDTEIEAQTPTNQAFVEAEMVNFPDTIVTDYSHPMDETQDEVTTTDLTFCTTGIALTKQGISKNPLGEDGGCDNVEYTFYVTHTGKPNETFSNIVIEDQMLDGLIPALPTTGDTAPLGVLSSGEKWEYVVVYPITAEDIMAGSVENHAYVMAESDTYPGKVASDVSDHTDINQDRPTVVDIPTCTPIISLIKKGVAKDGQGFEDGCAYIDYTFSVTNESTEGQVLENIVITDLDLDPPLFIPAVPNSGDEVNPGQLDPGETWVYENVEYQLTTADRLAGQVNNSALVTATMVGFPEITVEDTSDYESPTEDRPTKTILNNCEPRIALIKTGVVNAECNAIDYTFILTIESLTGEGFENVKLTDLDLPLDIQGPQGDGGLPGVLEPGETWTYTAKQAITPDDINFGCFHNQAKVTANVLAYPDYTVEDLSDDNSPDEDDVTEVDLSGCQNPAVGLIKQAELLDINNDGCPESVSYTFTLENIGDADLHDAVLNDDMLNGEVPGPTPESDDGGDGILSVGEIWTYQAIYDIVQADIDNGFVENTATVTLSNLCATAEVVDTSDDNSNTEDDPTQIEIPADACTDGNASIGLIKTGEVQDVNQDNCPESILYTFTVTNNGDVGLDTVELMDDALGGAIPGPVPGTDENEDGVLSPNESWTYEFLYELVQEDIDAGIKENQATVSAEPLGLDVKITDDSDDNSLLENDMTSTTIPNDACTTGSASLGLTKMGILTDVNQDGCDESILYTFVVINNGEVDLDAVEITDNFLSITLNEPLPGEDDGNDGVLSVSESWTYEALYAILDTDINNTFVQNTAQATAELVNTAIGIQDTSHPSDPLSDGPTITDVPANACTNGSAGIGLIKKGDLADAKGDGCTDSITYTFTVTNTGDVDLEELLLEDEKLGGYIAGPVPGTDDGNDGILSIGESWTFRTSYPLTLQDIDNGSVTNQATVSAQPVGLAAQISDISDDDSLEEDEQTVTAVPADACPSEGIDPNFEIYTGITPNGDGINDFFRIDGIEAYPNNTLRIFNRWGALVYEAEGYGIGNQVFTGISEGQATIMKDRSLPSGTYFYILEFETENPGEAAYSGYLYINRD